MKEEILQILQEIRPDVDFEAEKGLISEEILESLDLLSIITMLQDEIGIEIGNAEISAENFDSLEAITAMTERLKNA